MQNKEVITNNINDAARFAHLYEQYYPLAMHVAKRRLSCPCLAEDVVQEVFAKIWEKRKHNLIENLKSYLLVMIKNEACTYLRKQQLRLRLLTEKVSRESQYTSHDVMQEMEIRKLLQTSIKRMPAKRRKVYQLSFEFGYSTGEIAKMLQVSQNTVKNQLSVARQEVREYLWEMVA